MVSRAKKLSPDLKLTEEQKELLYGVILSDGWLELGKGNLNARVGLQLCLANKSLIDKFAKDMANFTSKDAYPKKIFKRVTPLGVDHEEWLIRTQTHKEFTKMIELFGGAGRAKTIPSYDNLMKIINWNVLAVILMCDGSYKNANTGCAMEIHFQSYSKAALDRLCLALYHKLGLRCWPSYYGKSKHNKINQYHIVISGFSQPQIEKKCKPLMLESFHYKVPSKSKRGFVNFKQSSNIFCPWLKSLKDINNQFRFDLLNDITQ